MDGIVVTLQSMSLVQMVLGWLFIGCYALALGGMLGPRGALRAGAIAFIAGVGFAALADDWVHGALLVMFSVAGLGLFVAASWLLTQTLAWWLSRAQRPAPDVPAVAMAEGAAAPRSLHALRSWWRTHVAPFVAP
ncbi:MAG: hypothetical protein KF891_06485 [Rhizobacter sp.]|nr:hypothetical protein [Rhizobacter sp.]